MFLLIHARIKVNPCLKKGPVVRWIVVEKGLTHWGWVRHICIGRLTIIGSDNDLSPGWRQAIIWTNAWILLIEPLGKNFSEILIGIQIFSLKKMHLKMLSAKWRPFCLGLNVIKLFLCWWSLLLDRVPFEICGWTLLMMIIPNDYSHVELITCLTCEVNNLLIDQGYETQCTTGTVSLKVTSMDN